MKQAKQDNFKGIVENRVGDTTKLWSSVNFPGFNAKVKLGG